ncbi:MAG: potassium channel protein [Phycisphaerales bacterium]|nr:potassium channel protein [Phycisphaerales bacterium]
MDAWRRFFLTLAMLLVLSIVGTVGYMIIERASLLNAAYMTVITMSTVGFSETVPLSTAGRVFTMMLIMVGVGAVYYATVVLFSIVVSGELQNVMEASKIKRRVEMLDGHAVICGYGRVGELVARQLGDAGTDFVVIERSEEQVERVLEDGHLYVHGDATEEDTLREAGIERARTLIAVLPDDAANVFVTLTARGLRPDLLIIARAETTTTEGKLLRAGANRVVCPEVIGATRISSLVTRPNVVDFVDIAWRGVDLQLDELVISEKSQLAGKSLRDSGLRERINAIVVAVKRSGAKTVFNPPPDHVLRPGETVIVIGGLGTSEKLASL